MKQIKVVIAIDGTATVEAVGFANSSCKRATKPIEEALGVVEKSTDKPEAFVSETNPNQATNSYGW